MNSMIDKLKDLDITITTEQMNQFEVYYNMLIEKNKVMNLTTITDIDEVIDKHFVDSLSLIKAVDLSQDLKILDLGTGAGFPGIPLKIVYPNLKITLLDSLNKRIKFLDEVIEELHLTGIESIHGRAEDFAQKMEHREKYDICVSRAVANLATLSEYCMPYLKIGGMFISYKAGIIEEELQAAKQAFHTLGGSIKEVITFNLPKTDTQRSLICINKNKKTPKTYPRKAGLPSKEPIK